MQLPCIHLNGTSKESLISDLVGASSALELAYQALKATAPNMRDFYPLADGLDAFKRATAEHMSRLSRLDAIKDEVDNFARGIDEESR